MMHRCEHTIERVPIKLWLSDQTRIDEVSCNDEDRPLARGHDGPIQRENDS